VTSFLYRALANLAVPLVPVALRDPRQRAAHEARLGAPARHAAWATAHRDPARPLVWCHAPSVGEGQQARSVLRALRLLRPDLQVAYTHFSPSAERFATTVGADVVDYLPYDRVADLGMTLDALRPDLLVFAKLDLWPELVAQARTRGIPCALVAGTVLADSGRLRWPSRAVLREAYAALAVAGAVGEDDVPRLVALGVNLSRITVTGDPRADAVIEGIDALSRDDPMCRLADDGRTIVAGSTWPTDDAVVLAAFAALRAHHTEARLVIVPHEPTTEHVAALEAQVAALDLPRPVRLSNGLDAAAPAAIVIVDSVGALARIYGGAVAAWVGGGFGGAGVHSVLEPAAWGVPIAIGPHDRGVREARLLAEAGALHRIGTADELAALWLQRFEAPERRQAAGEAARVVVARDRGAATRSAALLADRLPAAT
jgi:3-deoxy-D-manno-octulosonic-acid transferase